MEASVQKPSARELSDARAELQKIQSDRVALRTPAAAPAAETLTQRVSKIDELQRSLARTQQNLKK